MSDLTISSSRLTMSSREIAELVNSRHDSVKRTIERCAEKKAIQLPPLVEVKNHLGQTVQEFNLCKRDSLIVVAQLCPEFTARIVDRWQELEDSLALPTADVRELQAPSKSQIGGIVKSVIHKELAVAIQDLLPKMIEGAISKRQLLTRHRLRSRNGWLSASPAALYRAPASMMVSRISLPGLKCGIHFPGMLTFSPLLGFLPTRGGR